VPDARSEFESDTARAAGGLFLDVVARYFADTGRAAGPVSSPRTSAELARRFAEPLPLQGRPLEQVVARLERDVLGDGNRLCHPMYMGHQVSAPLPAAVWTESVIGALNNSLAVSEMSPTGTAVERQVIRWMGELAGFGAECGGTLTSGGTEATFTALLAARAASLPDAWEQGVGAAPPVVVYGENAHYAVTRAIGELGLGLKSGVVIPSREYRMDADALEAALTRLAREGRPVMAVVATAGSTPTGSFDDLSRIAALCEPRGLWLHVDGAHGASALLSRNHRPLLAGLERARSIAWDPHKMMLLPLAAGVVLVREQRDLEAAFAQRAPYLFHGAEDEPTPDQGIRSFACSRRADALKLWVALQRYGADGIGALYDHLCALTVELHRLIAGNPAFEAVHTPECNILCFRYVGRPRLPGERIDPVNKELRERVNRSGAAWITTTTLAGRRVLRVTVMNPRTEAAHLVALLAVLEREAQSLL
jgi:L-2,4-diaminobutyrate decarboxylase